MKVQRGDVVFLDFPFSDGSGGKVRPAVVLQSDHENQRLTSTVVAMISGNLNLVGREPGHSLIDIESEDGRGSGLKYSSAVNVHSLYSVHCDRIERISGSLTENLMQQIAQQLAATLDLARGFSE